jgi:hypothetical protein
MSKRHMRITVDAALEPDIETVARVENRSLSNAIATLLKEALPKRQQGVNAEHVSA